MEEIWDEGSACVLCGAYFGYWYDDEEFEPTSWMSQLRVVYTASNTWMRPLLSCVGKQTEDGIIFAPDPQNDCDGRNVPNMRDPQDMEFLATDYGGYSGLNNDRFWGFPMHAVCWSLLEKLHSPREVDIEHLFNLFRSFPVQPDDGYSGRCLYWGHDYGGLFDYKLDPEHLTPGAECHLFRGETNFPPHEVNPWFLPDVEQVLRQSLLAPEERISAQVVVHRDTKMAPLGPEARPVFPPLEIQLLILDELPSRDVGNLKLAWKELNSTSLPATFWRSRFQRGFEFHCFFEAKAQSTPAKGRSWHRLYKAVGEVARTDAFKNRRRIWEILLSLDELLVNLSSVLLEGELSHSFFEPHAPKDFISWKSACGKLQDPAEDFEDGCRALWTRTAHVNPRQVMSFFASFIEINKVSYVSGLRFQQRDGAADVCLGYIHPKNEFGVDLRSLVQNQSRPIIVCGFHVAVDARGIRAIAPILERQLVAEWIGNASGIPVMHLIERQPEDVFMKGEFDALKLVSLGISSAKSVDPDCLPPVPWTVSVRDTAQWVPGVPEDGLCLNDASFLIQFPRQPFSYQPLTMLLFGGQQGIYLSSLAAIRVCMKLGRRETDCNQNPRIYGIEFLYKPKRCSSGGRPGGGGGEKIGGSGPSPLALAPELSSHWEDYMTGYFTLKIDGEGGELIDYINPFKSQAEHIEGFQIKTNHGCLATFPPSLDADEEGLPAHVIIPSSTTITGLYAHLEHDDNGDVVLESLGVISENLVRARRGH